ncbi:uncharacterized protein LOC6562300 [Drosophila grimshawi]|uniref:GH10997 n=1 Tax=Drosophila grimshawi TaxID=7222 RepID=B4JBR1_DROGR|nr:uncharacterized protein LOC6562300 [Drosophila grimshawi]EDW02996.1 GH10997 [Drosophila grimshawi]
MMLNPIEIVCFYVAQPIIDFLAYLLNDVHYLVFLAAICMIGVFFGIGMGIVSVIWYKYGNVKKIEKEQYDGPEYEGYSTNGKEKNE